MTRRTALLTGVLAMISTPIAYGAEPPAAGPSPSTKSDPDRLVIDALKEVHNRGADLYNTGDSAGCFRMYQGALLTARAFLGHRPAVQKVIDDGLADVAKTEGVKIQAFRLHEVIEDVRAKLKDEIKKAKDPGSKDEPKPKPDPKVEPPPKPLPPTGTVTLDGKPLAGGDVTFVSLDAPAPAVFTAIVRADGTFQFDGAIPAGNYAVLVNPGPAAGKIPDKYQDAGKSGLRAKVAGGANVVTLALTGK